MTEPSPASWRPIDSAPKDTEVLVYTRPWGAIVASYSEEFGNWLSRMQVPVSIREENEMPTHWQPLPPPPDGAADEGRDGHEAALPTQAAAAS